VFCVAGAVIVPHFVLWVLSSCHILCCRHCCCVAMVGVILLLCLLCGRGGCHHAVLHHGQGCCIAIVGVITLCCVAVGVVVWSWWVLCCVVSRSGLLCGYDGCRRTILCCGQGCCVVTMGVVTLHGTVVIGLQKRKLAEKREKKKRKTYQRVH
jgi:hypothetical protein